VTSDYYADSTIKDSEILAYHAGRAMGAGRIYLGTNLAKLALAAHTFEQRGALAAAVPATPPPIFQQAEQSTSWFAGEGPTAGHECGPGCFVDGQGILVHTSGPADPPPGVRAVATARCVGPTWRDGVQVDCREAVWLKPGEEGREGVWLHVDPDRSTDHTAVVLPNVHDRAVAHEEHMNGNGQ
jgi:hypothetical protein